MLRARWGRMIFISSVVGLYGSPGQVNYAASKAGLVGVARSITRELGGRNITANVVAPGFIDTDMTAALPEERKAEYRKAIPAGRIADARRGRRRWSPGWPATPPGTSPARSSPSTAASAWGTERPEPPRPLRMTEELHVSGLLAGKRLLVTGVITDQSIAFSVAKLAQENGATVVLTGFGRLSLVERIAKRLPEPAPVIELDVTNPEHLAGLADRVREHVDGLDGVVHSVGFAPASCLGGGFLDAPWEDVATAVHVSTYSYKSLAMAALPLMAAGRRGGRTHLRRHQGLAGL